MLALNDGFFWQGQTPPPPVQPAPQPHNPLADLFPTNIGSEIWRGANNLKSWFEPICAITDPFPEQLPGGARWDFNQAHGPCPPSTPFVPPSPVHAYFVGINLGAVSGFAPTETHSGATIGEEYLLALPQSQSWVTLRIPVPLDDDLPGLGIDEETITPAVRPAIWARPLLQVLLDDDLPIAAVAAIVDEIYQLPSLPSMAAWMQRIATSIDPDVIWPQQLDEEYIPAVKTRFSWIVNQQIDPESIWPQIIDEEYLLSTPFLGQPWTIRQVLDTDELPIAAVAATIVDEEYLLPRTILYAPVSLNPQIHPDEIWKQIKVDEEYLLPRTILWAPWILNQPIHPDEIWPQTKLDEVYVIPKVPFYAPWILNPQIDPDVIANLHEDEYGIQTIVVTQW